MALANDPKKYQIGSKSLIKSLALSPYTVATVPSAAEYSGRMIYVANGAAWLRILLGAAVATA